MTTRRIGAGLCAVVLAGCAPAAPLVDKVVLGPGNGEIRLNGRLSSRGELGGEAARLYKAGGELWLTDAARSNHESDTETAVIEMLVLSRVKLHVFTDASFAHEVVNGAPGSRLNDLAKVFSVDIRLPAYWNLIDMAGGTDDSGALVFVASVPTGEGVTILEDPTRGRSLARYVHDQTKEFVFKPGSVRPFKICHGTQDAVYADFITPRKELRPGDPGMIGFGVFALNRKTAVTAAYLRVATAPENPDVRADVQNVCHLPR